MKIIIGEDLASAIKTLHDYCDNTNCSKCIFYVNDQCLIRSYSPATWNVNEETTYFIEYNK